MVRRLNTRGWKGLVLVAIAAGALLWHVLACVESPMSFAPNGDLAFTTVEPYGGEGNIALRGTAVYRLMVLPAGADEPKVLEESSDWMITAPGFSPDGKRIAYLRIPLLTEPEFDKIARASQAAAQATQQATSRPADVDWPNLPEAAAAAIVDVALPSIEPSLAFYSILPTAPVASASLVERRASDGKVISTTDTPFPLMFTDDKASEGIPRALLLTYIMARQQYSPDGRRVYVCLGGLDPGTVVLAVDPSAHTASLVASQAMGATLSPDGLTLAVGQKDCCSFVRTDGSITSYVPWKEEGSLGGFTWATNDKLALLGRKKVGEKEAHVLWLLKTDGKIAQTIDLPEMKGGESANTGQLAISLEAKRIVVAFDQHAYFLDGDGKLLTSWEHEADSLAQPTFTSDGEQVAFKYMRKGEGDTARAEAIVFFSADGKELRRVAIPPAKLPETQPATTRPGGSMKPPALQGDASATGATSASAIQPSQEKALEEMTPEPPTKGQTR